MNYFGLGYPDEIYSWIFIYYYYCLSASVKHEIIKIAFRHSFKKYTILLASYVAESQFCDGASVEIIQFLAAFLRPFAFDTAGSNQKNVYAYPLDTLWLRQIVRKKISFWLRHHKF